MAPASTTSMESNSKADLDDSTVAYFENMIRDLEMADEGQTSSCLRNIFLNYDVGDFLRRLNERIHQHDSSIDKVCQHHYQGFVDSFQKLINIRGDATSLKERVISTTQNLMVACTRVSEDTGTMLRAEKTEDNVISTMVALEPSMPVFDAYRQLKQTMDMKDFYGAIRMIDQLKGNLLPTVTRYRWSKCIYNQIRRFREAIAFDSLDQLKSFLEQVSTMSEMIGKIAFRKVIDSLEDPSHPMLIDTIRLLGLLQNLEKRPSVQNPFFEQTEKDMTKDDLTLPDLLNFVSVHKAVNLNTILNTIGLLSKHYKNEKKKQINVVMDLPSTINFASFRRFMLRATGFFVVEDYILNSTRGFIDRRFYNELIRTSLPRLNGVIRNTIRNCKSANEMLNVKISVLIFCETMKDYFYPIRYIFRTLRESRSAYFDSLLSIYSRKFRKMFEEDTFTTLIVESSTDWEQLKSKYAYFDFEKALGSNRSFPRNLGFSALVPELYCAVCEFAADCYKYCDGLYPDSDHLIDLIGETLDRLMSEKMHRCLLSVLNDKNRTLSQLIQICINASQLEIFMKDVDKTLAQVIKSRKSWNLDGASVFKQFRNEAQRKIYFQLNNSVDQFLELASYDWMISESTGIASTYLIDLLNFLRSTFKSFEGMSPDLTRTALIGTCGHIATSMMDRMLDPEVRCVSYGSLEQLELDLIQCEQFVDEMSHVVGQSVFESFAEFRQLLDLVISKNWTTYFSNASKSENRFDRIDPKKTLILVEKLRDGLKRSKGLLGGLRTKQGEKEEKRVLNTVAEELELIINNNNNNNNDDNIINKMD